MSDITMQWQCKNCDHVSTYTCNEFNRNVTYDDKHRPWVSQREVYFEIGGPMLDRSELGANHACFLYSCPICGSVTTVGYEMARPTSKGKKRAEKTAAL